MCNQTTIATPEISEFTLQTPEILYPVKDDSYRLTGETRTGGSTGSPSGYSIAYTYDNVGNRMTQIRNGVPISYVYNARDQLVSEDSAGVVTTYAYDAAGRMIGKTIAGVSTTYGWEDNDRMVSVNGPGVAIRYVYDHNGQRVTEETTADTVNYLIDYQLPYGQVVAETDGGGNLVATYVYGLDRISMDRGGNTFVYATDGQGSVRQLTGTSGNVTDSYYYTAFGEELAKTGSTENRYRYVGESFDPNSGFYNLRARWYSPREGRFTSSDPYSGDPQSPLSLHQYLYGGCDPVDNIDPSGNMFEGLALQSNIIAAYSTISMVTLRAALPWVIRGAAVVVLSIAIADVKDHIIGNVEDKYLPSALVALAIMANGFSEFQNGKDFKNKPGKHTVALMGTSGAISTPESVVWVKRIGPIEVTLLKGGGAGRVFEFRYEIGKGYNGQGLFLFRLDYYDYTDKGNPKPGMHYHMIFGGKPDKHNPLPES